MTRQRPLSPILQYRPQLTSALSFAHRVSGVLLSLGAICLSVWLVSIAAGAEAYALINRHIAAWYGQLAIFGFAFSLYYHLCNGIRHLFWDLGLGLELSSAYRSGYAVLATTLALTILTFWGGSAT